MTPADDEDEARFELPDGSWSLARRHVNEDGTIGGWVPAALEVPDGVYIESNVIIHPGVEISPGAKILGPCQIMPTNVMAAS